MDESWTYFCSMLTTPTQAFVPLKRIQTKAKRKNEWIKNATKKEIRKKDIL